MKAAEKSPVAYIQMGHNASGMDQSQLSSARRERDQVGGIARSEGLGKSEPEEDLQVGDQRAATGRPCAGAARSAS